MNAFFRIALCAVTAMALIHPAAADKPRKPRSAEKSETVEARAGDVVLPSDAQGTLVMKTCPQCPLKTYAVTGKTRYSLYNRATTLSEMRAAVAAAGNPNAYVGVTYLPKNAEVTAVNAHAKRVSP